MKELLILFGLLSVMAYVWATVKIYIFLQKKNVKMEHFVFIRLFIFKYVSKYKAITKSETGKTGWLFYIWILSINLLLLCIVVFLVDKYLL